jgi:hypothetical protein
MLIFTKTLTSVRIPLDIQGTTTVMEVKWMICRLTGFPANQQRLILEGSELRDRRTLNSYNVVENALLLIIRRGHLRLISEAFERVFDSLDELQRHTAGFQLYGESLALHRVFDSVEELQMHIVGLQNYEERLDEALYDIAEAVE